VRGSRARAAVPLRTVFAPWGLPMSARATP